MSMFFLNLHKKTDFFIPDMTYYEGEKCPAYIGPDSDQLIVELGCSSACGEAL
jgi:hypothetical protein